MAVFGWFLGKMADFLGNDGLVIEILFYFYCTQNRGLLLRKHNHFAVNPKFGCFWLIFSKNGWFFLENDGLEIESFFYFSCAQSGGLLLRKHKYFAVNPKCGCFGWFLAKTADFLENDGLEIERFSALIIRTTWGIY